MLLPSVKFKCTYPSCDQIWSKKNSSDSWYHDIMVLIFIEVSFRSEAEMRIRLESECGIKQYTAISSVHDQAKVRKMLICFVVAPHINIISRGANPSVLGRRSSAVRNFSRSSVRSQNLPLTKTQNLRSFCPFPNCPAIAFFVENSTERDRKRAWVKRCCNIYF